MDLGLIGLGRMGSSLAQRLMESGHGAVVYDTNPSPVADLVSRGAIGVESVAELAAKLAPPRAVWVMVPAAVTGGVIDRVATHLEAGDIIIDGGNSYYLDDLTRSDSLAERGIHLVDVGTSGGVFGLERGFCLMIGGDKDAVSRLDPVFRALAPGVAGADRTPGRSGDPLSEEQGYLHCGPVGAGHFTKMVHNGIEYGIMAAYAEGLNVLHHAGIGLEQRSDDAETAPLRNPEHYSYTLDIPAIAEVWRRGSVIASWLLDLTAAELYENPGLDGFSGKVSDSGEGRWTLLSAIEEGVPAPILAASIFGRLDSRGRNEYADKLLSAMRYQFGGHEEKKDS
ncbi:MAG: decarboxylating 6-phosphogluconate dehydrogenase [Acidimicrobiia bacterium]